MKNYIDLLRQRKFESIEKDIASSLKTKLTRDLLLKMADAIPSQAPVSVKIVGANQFRNSGIDIINLTFEYEFPTNWLLINVATQKEGGTSTIFGFNVYLQPDSLENTNRFTLAGKTILQHLLLVFAILVPIFTVYALIRCIRTKIEKKKWLWVIFILMGIGKLTVNWTTNTWSLAPLTFQLLGGGFFAPPFGAWLISVSLPLGAFVFLLRRKNFDTSAVPSKQTKEKEDQF